MRGDAMRSLREAVSRVAEHVVRRALPLRRLDWEVLRR
jgi:hypothetical protein